MVNISNFVFNVFLKLLNDMDDDLEPKAKMPKVAKVIVAKGFNAFSQFFFGSGLCRWGPIP